MIRINLLPYRERRKKENIRRQVSVFFLSFILFIIALYYFQTFLNGKIERMNAKIAATKAELAKYAKINKEIDSIIKKLDILKKKTQVIQNLQGERHQAVLLLDAMTRAVVPKRMWFTRLASGKDTVSIDGIALDNKTIADFMLNLERTHLFTAVSLKSIRQKKIGGKNIALKKFSIVCNKVPLVVAGKTKKKP